ncbi:MAG: DUF2156 domain-containing protein [Deferrisomatales bacterium]|nr:DUF2156 domain-containing protein [Deferrisomatales bacterium]
MSAVPVYPEFHPLELTAAGSLRPALAGAGTALSEFAFANLFLFRRAHHYRWSTWRGMVLVVGQGYDGAAYAMPPLGAGDVGGAIPLLERYLERQGVRPVFFPVPEACLAQWFSPPQWAAVADRDQGDYLYLREELATLPGKKFHKRRNRLEKFLREEGAGYVYRELGDEHREQCLQLAAGWCEIRCSLERPSTYLETAAAKEALELRRELGLRGGVVLLGGRVRAFCLGEELTADTFVVHFEKTEPGHEGLAQVINRDFCLHALGGYRYVNREQDLGDPGLRRAKESYHPVRLVPKYRVQRG